MVFQGLYSLNSIYALRLLSSRNIYKPIYPNYPMETKRMIVKVTESKTGQKRVTIPKQFNVRVGEYIEIRKVKFKVYS